MPRSTHVLTFCSPALASFGDGVNVHNISTFSVELSSVYEGRYHLRRWYRVLRCYTRPLKLGELALILSSHRHDFG
ncbi:hypothetical protein C8Q72DRAFT_253468 [Fomitopsis betulina]|nr:hypothetical protein C8Q72DRAFT_253468 [Fomitopsis betulina]